MLDQHPLLGLGLNTFSVYYEFQTGRTDWGPHSFYVALIAETGLIGSLAFGLFLIWLLIRLAVLKRAAWALARAGDPDEARAGPLADGLLAALLGTMAANIFYLTMQFYYFYALVLVIVTAAELYAPAPARARVPAAHLQRRRSARGSHPREAGRLGRDRRPRRLRPRAAGAPRARRDPSPPTREIIVVDSGEAGGPAAWLRRERPDVLLIEPGENLGFGAANNRGIARSTGRYVLLLNPDAFVDEGCLGELVRFLESHPQAVAVGPRLRFGDGGCSARAAASPRSSASRPSTSDCAPCAALAAAEHLLLRRLRARRGAAGRLADRRLRARARRPAARRGRLRRGFFLYSEEIDLLRRLADEGGETWFDPQAGAVHLWGGVTSNDPGPGLPRAAAQPRALPAQALGPARRARACASCCSPGSCCARRATPGYRQALRWLARATSTRCWPVVMRRSLPYRR